MIQKLEELRAQGLESNLDGAGAASSSSSPMPRIAIYSHDSFGLGHLRRNLLLAGALQRWVPGGVEVLIVTGSPRAYFFDAPRNTRVVKLPAVSKDDAGHYVSRNSGVSLMSTLRARKGIIRESILSFKPDVFVVDHTPLGLCGELLPLLGDLRSRSTTKIVIGLRDILDEPACVIEDWRRHGVERVLSELYHHLWVYGDSNVFSLGDLYRMSPSLKNRLVYLGYLGREPFPDGNMNGSASNSFPDPKRPHLLCLLGGGEDGHPLAEGFLNMLRATHDAWNGTLVTGPFFARERRNQVSAIAENVPHIQMLRFTASIEHLDLGSDLIISMGGYNSVLEAISCHKRVLVLPRVFPRREQWLRAQEFERRGLVRSIAPEDLSAENLANATRKILSEAPPPAPSEIGLSWDGARAFARHIQEVVSDKVSQEGTQHAGIRRQLRA